MEVNKGRVGQFFLVVGLFFFTLFFATDQSSSPQVWTFFAGMAGTTLGVYMMWTSFKPQKSTRFRLFNDARQKQAAKKQSMSGKK